MVMGNESLTMTVTYSGKKRKLHTYDNIITYNATLFTNSITIFHFKHNSYYPYYKM